MAVQGSLDLFDAPEWVDAFAGPEPSVCDCPLCECRNKAEAAGRCADCWYDIHFWEKRDGISEVQ